MPDFLSAPWPWYVAGPVIGLFVPALLLAGNRTFGVSSNLRHMCSALLPGRIEHFRYDWKRTGLWNLLFAAGTLLGASLAARWGGVQAVGISEQTRLALTSLGIHDFSGLAPREVFTWSALLTVRGFVSIVLGGFLVGFGAAYVGGVYVGSCDLRSGGPSASLFDCGGGLFRGRPAGNPFYSSAAFLKRYVDRANRP